MGNHAGSDGGGVYGGTLVNCIVYYNTANFGSNVLNTPFVINCCTYPTNFMNGYNITNAPGFVNTAEGDFHLQIGSPCINVGTNAFAPAGPDLDGNLRIVDGIVDVGAYENQYTGTVHYVSLSSANPAPPYTKWSTAATNIQDAVGAAQNGEIVVAADGIYKLGSTIIYGQEANRVALTNAITLLGLYGPQSTVIVGGIQMRCVYVGSNAALNGFTLADGQTRDSGDVIQERSGGGAWCETSGVASNCVFGGTNFPYADGGKPDDGNRSLQGGGIYGGTVYNSTFANNRAANGGAAAAANLFNCVVVNNNNVGYGRCGGIYQGTASNCTFTGNSANFDNGGGGGYQSTLYNCTLTGNQGGAGGTYSCTNYNCTLANNSGVFGGGASLGILYHCTVISNTASVNGGGTYGGTLLNCLLIGNSATNPTYGLGGGNFEGALYNCTVVSNTANSGGGVFLSALYNCTLGGNSAGGGGGAIGGTLYNCTVVNNTATVSGGGGVLNGSLYNCIVFYNSAPFDSNYSGGTFNYCDTTPLVFGFGNITNEPVFVNLVGGDFHLQSNSPCINSGNNSYVTTTADVDGNTRIVGGTVDIGAYEYQTPTSVISYAWLQQYGLTNNGTTDYTDWDGDQMNNWQEWKAGTIPTNAASVLQLSSPSNSVSGTTITWQSVSGVTYYLQRSTNLSAQPVFSTIQSNIIGQTGTTSYLDTAAGHDLSIYRVGVQ